MGKVSGGQVGSLAGAGIGAAVGGPIGMGIGSAAGGIIGGLFDSNDSEADLQKAMEALDAIPNMSDYDKAIALNQYKVTGTFTPQLMDKINLNADKATTLTENPENRQKQEAALSALQGLSQSGMSAADIAQAREMQGNVNANTQAQLADLKRAALERGQSGAGDTLASQLMATQGGAQTASKNASDLAVAAAAARREALNQYLSGASGLRAQDSDIQKYNTSNDIQRQQFLDQNSISRQQANNQLTNNANMYNTQNAQNIGNMNTQAANAELESARQRQMQQAQFNADKAKARANAYMGQASNAQTQANNSAQNTTNMISGIGQLAANLPKSTSSTSTLPKAAQAYNNIQDRPLGSKAEDYQALAHGGFVDGEAEVKGDSEANDTQPAMLSPGELVIPRSHAHDPKLAKAFIDYIHAQKKKADA